MSEGVVHQLHQKNGQARVLIVRHAQILQDVGVAGLAEEAALLLEQGAVPGPADMTLLIIHSTVTNQPPHHFVNYYSFLLNSLSCLCVCNNYVVLFAGHRAGG